MEIIGFLDLNLWNQSWSYFFLKVICRRFLLILSILLGRNIVPDIKSIIWFWLRSWWIKIIFIIKSSIPRSLNYFLVLFWLRWWNARCLKCWQKTNLIKKLNLRCCCAIWYCRKVFKIPKSVTFRISLLFRLRLYI